MTSRAAADRYARALFDVARKEGANLESIGRELTGLAELIADNAPLARVLENPAIPAAKKRGVLEQLLAKSPVSPILSKLLLMLADRDRLTIVRELAEAYRARLMQHQQVIRAEITTAVALPPDRVAALQQGIARATGRRHEDVQLETRVDPSIIGGAVTRIGSTVYDGSVTTQLQKLKLKLAETEA